MNDLEMLWDLQETEKRAQKIKWEFKNLDSLKNLEEARLEFKEKEKIIKAKKDDINEDKKKLRRLEMKNQEALGEMEGIKKEMYDEKGYTTKELMQMEKKVQSLSQENNKLEDLILQEMENIEKKEEEVNKDLKELEEHQKHIKKLEKIWKKESGDLKKEYSKLKEKINKLRKEVPRDLLDKYESIKEVSNYNVVAMVKGDICMGCKVSLSSSVVGKLYTPGIRLTCENCGRLIFLGEGKGSSSLKKGNNML